MNLVSRRGMLRRIAVLSVHTSPLDQPGLGDAGGMNVYVLETARRLANAGVEVDILTRATSPDQPCVTEVSPGVGVRHVRAGPVAVLDRQVDRFAAAVLSGERRRYDLVHSHYWLAGLAGLRLATPWSIPLVHSMHTTGRVKDLGRRPGDGAESTIRISAETAIVAAADRLVANTAVEAGQLVTLYGADPARVVTVSPGVDLELFRPGDRAAARACLGLAPDAVVLLFAGRVQPLKAPDVLIRAAAELVAADPSLRDRLVVAVVGGPSGAGLNWPAAVHRLAWSLGIGDLVRFEPPLVQHQLAKWYRAADLTVMPSRSESFGLVALESQACGTPVLAASVGGLPTVVADARMLVEGHDPVPWANAIAALLGDATLRQRLGHAGLVHAQKFSWQKTANGLLAVYAATVEANRAVLRGQVMGA